MVPGTPVGPSRPLTAAFHAPSTSPVDSAVVMAVTAVVAEAAITASWRGMLASAVGMPAARTWIAAVALAMTFCTMTVAPPMTASTAS